MTILQATPSKTAIYVKSKPVRVVDAKIIAQSGAVQVSQYGSTLKLSGVWSQGGHGPKIESGDLFQWIGGGSSGPSKQYGCGYFGNLHPSPGNPSGTRIKRVELYNLDFIHSSTGDSLLRLMGVDEMDIVDCTFNQVQNKFGKECLQPRHVRKLTISRSRIYGNITTGVLRPKACKTDEERASYYADAEKYRTNIVICDSDISGYIDVQGQTDLALNDVRLLGPDGRPQSNRTACIMLESRSGIKAPTVKLAGVDNKGWKKVMA